MGKRGPKPGFASSHRKTERNDELGRLFSRGWSGNDLAERFNITRARVYQIVKKFGYERGTKR